MQQEEFDHLLTRLTPVPGKKNEYYCPNCGAENLKANPRKAIFSTYSCGCTFKEVINAVYPKSGEERPKITPFARPVQKIRPTIKPIMVSEGDPCKVCGEEDTPCYYTDRDIRCSVEHELSAEKNCPPGYEYLGAFDGKQVYLLKSFADQEIEEPGESEAKPLSWEPDKEEEKRTYKKLGYFEKLRKLEKTRDKLQNDLLKLKRQLLDVDPFQHDTIKIQIDLVKTELSLTRNKIESLKAEESYRKQQERQSSESKTDSELSSFAKDYKAIWELLEGRLRFNDYKKMIEIDGKLQSLEQPRANLTRITGFSNWYSNDLTVLSILLDMAQQNTYHPIVEYLEQVCQKYSDATPDFLDDLAYRWYGVADPLQNLYLKITLIGAVKRALSAEPTMHRYMLILQSNQQKVGKTTSLEKLFGEFFGSGQLLITDKSDSVTQLAMSWCHEVGECDLLFGNRHSSAIKDFVSRTFDTVRLPYARSHSTIIRRSIIVGTTNRTDFLADETGSTRYLIIQIPQGWRVPLDLIEQERDEVWAAAVAAYYSGIPNDLPDELLLATERKNLDFREVDDWEDAVTSYLKSNPGCTTAEILIHACRMEMAHITRQHSLRIGRIGRLAGYDTVPIHGRREWYVKGDLRLGK